jgi:hypothetical protein
MAAGRFVLPSEVSVCHSDGRIYNRSFYRIGRLAFLLELLQIPSVRFRMSRGSVLCRKKLHWGLRFLRAYSSIG